MDERIKKIIRENSKKKYNYCYCGKTATQLECKIGEAKLFPVCDIHIINREEKENNNG